MAQQKRYNILLYGLILMVILLCGPATNGYASGGKECPPEGCIGHPLGPAIRATLMAMLEDDSRITIMISNGICTNGLVSDITIAHVMLSGLGLTLGQFQNATAQGLSGFIFELGSEEIGQLFDTDDCSPQRLTGNESIYLEVHGVRNFSNDDGTIMADVVLLFFAQPQPPQP